MKTAYWIFGLLLFIGGMGLWIVYQERHEKDMIPLEAFENPKHLFWDKFKKNPSTKD